MSVGRTYCLGPTFRAEKSKTRRHLIEFWMLEPEVAFAELADIIELAEGLICHAVGRVIENRAAELETLGRDPAPLRRIRAPFPRMTYDEAAEVLARKGAGFHPRLGLRRAGGDGADRGPRPPALRHPLPRRHQGVLHGARSRSARPGALPRHHRPEGYGEVVGGGQRIHDLDLLRRRVVEHDLPEDAFSWYLDLRRYGSAPHSGFGLGIERFVAWMAGLSHLREAIAFPRTLYRLAP